MHQSIQPNYNLRYQDSYSPEYPPLHQVTTRFPLYFPPFYKTFYSFDTIRCCFPWCHGDLLNLQYRLYDVIWSDAHLVFLLRTPWPTCMNSRRTLTLGCWEDSVSRYYLVNHFKTVWAHFKCYQIACILSDGNTAANLFDCPYSCLVTLTTASGFPTTVTLPAHPCPTSAQGLKPPVTVASQPPSSTG